MQIITTMFNVKPRFSSLRSRRVHNPTTSNSTIHTRINNTQIDNDVKRSKYWRMKENNLCRIFFSSTALLLYLSLSVITMIIINRIYQHDSLALFQESKASSFIQTDTDAVEVTETDADTETPVQLEITKQKTNTNSPYAYTWLVGSIHEDKLAYRGFLYNIAIAAKILREKGSTADFVLWAQISPESKSLNGKLPEEDERLLREVGVQIRMLDKVHNESFAQLVYEKFRVLTMTEYKRVIFMDADIMPRSHLDYIFHLSVSNDGLPPLLRPNLILATRGEPCNTSMFMVEPSMNGWKLLKDTIERQHKEGAKLDYPHFDRKRGWGYSFLENDDPWLSISGKKGWRWTFHAAHSDQGLMYYFAKFGMKDTSIIIGDILQNFVPGSNGLHMKDFEGNFQSAIAERNLTHLLPKPESKKITYGCANAGSHFKCKDMPYLHMVHFSGENKPWQHSINKRNTMNRFWYVVADTWYDNLRQLNEKYNIGLDIDNWDVTHKDIMQESPLGYVAKYTDHKHLVHTTVNSTTTDHNDKQTEKIQESPETLQVKVSSNAVKDTNINTLNVEKAKAPTIAYVVSFIQCSGTATNSAGLVDASLVLRHSIHQISSRNPKSGSKYDYKMYAIVHRQAEACSETLKHTGFEIILVDPPLQKREIRGEYLQKNIHKEFCCGHDEFVKLYAYNKVPEQIFVHVDIDFAFYKPMDHLFDAMMYSKDSEEGKRARSMIERERADDEWPDQIEAFITRDWHQVAPNKFPPGYQAGFIVGRRNPKVFDEIVKVIKEGNYTEGWGYTCGWGGKGYGGYVGAMAMQGLMGYYYDHIRPNTAVELNQCRYNHMGLDVRYNAPPNFNRRYGKKGQCRNNNPDDICEDCMVTESDKIYSAHYTQCRKPWACIGTAEPGGRKPGGARASAINSDVAHLDHCMMLLEKWHLVRLDLENKLFELTGDTTIREASIGKYKEDVFQGHCKDDGYSGYLNLAGKSETFSRIPELYGE